MWSQKHSCCQQCGTTETRHVARGLCSACYYRRAAKRRRGSPQPRGSASSKLSRAFLEKAYLERRQSLEDIARECGCSRQYVHKRLNEYGIRRRSLAEARAHALSQGKLKFQRPDGRTVTLQKQRHNETFFNIWTPAMAYVLGVIITDGWLIPGRRRDPSSRAFSTPPQVGLFQKEPELLEKVLALMGSNARIYHHKERTTGNVIAGEGYRFLINSKRIFDRLVFLGVTPAKSLTMEFPDVPEHLVSHFLRGCWDGDGSFYRCSRGQGHASFVSGSRKFIERVEDVLRRHGMPRKKIYVENRGKNPSYTIRYNGQSPLIRFFKIFYMGVNESMYLTRKFEILSDILGLSSPSLPYPEDSNSLTDDE